MKSPICRDPALSYWPPGILGDHFFQQLIPVHPAIQNCISNWTYKLKETRRILIMMMMTKKMMEERFRLRAGSSCFSSQKPCFPPPQTNVSLWWWFANAWQRYAKVSNSVEYNWNIILRRFHQNSGSPLQLVLDFHWTTDSRVELTWWKRYVLASQTLVVH